MDTASSQGAPAGTELKFMALLVRPASLGFQGLPSLEYSTGKCRSYPGRQPQEQCASLS